MTTRTLNADEVRRLNSASKLQRLMEVSTINVEERTVELSFSSELEYERWWGVEILDHGRDSVDLSRLQDGAPLLFNHDWDKQLGVIESVRIDPDRKGRAVVRFSRSSKAEEKFQDVQDKILTKVSVGYAITDAVLQEVRDGTEVYRITGWEPYEISFVTVPADNTVGVGRSHEMAKVDQPEPAAETAGKPVPSQEERKMTQETVPAVPANPAAERQAGADSERSRVRSISDMGTQYKATDLAMRFIAEGKSPEEFQRALLEQFNERAARPLAEQNKDAEIGLTDKEARNFSILKAVRAMAPNASAKDREEAKFELECSEAAQRAYGKSAKGVLIPADVLGRTFSTTTPGGGPGANIVATNLLAGSFIDLLRKKAWLMQYATTLGGLVGNVDIPRQNGATQAYWVGEGSAPTPSDPSLDQIHFTPKTLGAYTDITRRLLMQSTPDAEGLVRNDLLKVLALEMDRVGIYGSGSGSQPKGLKNISGINAKTFGAAGAPTFAEIVDMETKIALGNADVDSMVYAVGAGIRGYAKSTLKFAVNGSSTLWEPGNTLNGYGTAVSNQIATNDVFFGDWSQLIIALWGGLDLTVDPYSLSTSGGLRLVVFQDMDVNVRHPESFCYGA